MEYTEDKLTEWFDVKKHSPKEVGVYEIQLFSNCDLREIPGSINLGWFAFWDGFKFCSSSSNIDRASNLNYFSENSGLSATKWRGLNFDPNAPKPKKGNKRKTMYVVMNHEPVIARPMASFSSLKNAQIYAENYFFAKISKIRFRTPEHD